MVVESGIVHIKPGDEAKYESGYAQVRHVLESAPGCRKVEVRRGVEIPSTYLLLIWWDSVDAHIAFTKSQVYGGFMGAIGGYVAAPPQLLHYGEPL